MFLDNIKLKIENNNYNLKKKKNCFAVVVSDWSKNDLLCPLNYFEKKSSKKKTKKKKKLK